MKASETSNSVRPLSSHSAQALAPFGASTLRPLKLLFNVERWRERIDFSFVISGRLPDDLDRLVLPTPLEPSQRRRQDELWQSTCLELFLAPADRSSYVEMNLSPAGHWNIYHFEKYREGMRPVADPTAPLIKAESSSVGDSFIWHGSLRAESRTNGGELGQVLQASGLVMSATAVLEYKTGDREYWALAHVGEKPDFHLRDSFCLAL